MKFFQDRPLFTAKILCHSPKCPELAQNLENLMIQKIQQILQSDIGDSAKVAQIGLLVDGYKTQDQVIAMLKGALGAAPKFELPTDTSIDFDHGGHCTSPFNEWKLVYHMRDSTSPRGSSKPETVLSACKSFGIAQTCEIIYAMGDNIEPGQEVEVGSMVGTAIRKPNPFQWWIQIPNNSQPLLVERRQITNPKI